jgi:hypothetical protein
VFSLSSLYVNVVFSGRAPRTSRLYRNNGDGSFTDITTSSHVSQLPGCATPTLTSPHCAHVYVKLAEHSLVATGVFLDVDDDADLDLYLASVGECDGS